ncbi:MAG: A/G-specific adenine glycosylase [Deltaproteobacteria bacterium]|nr:A/G-specific adenine glycosylase [Deltaproteobacteria bacterium]
MPGPTDPLLAWYASRARRLPWREDPPSDPDLRAYRTLVSEVMLQQTRADTVIEYYTRFLEHFPTVEDLARAPIEEVLKQWAGLGYYGRARHLHAAARAVWARGVFPRTAAELVHLPGLGPYSAGAVASIAFGEAVPAVDGNVRRVVARLTGQDPAPSSGIRQVEAWVRSRIPPDRAGAFNQALMDLGATVCVPRRPRCADCPLARECLARARGIEASVPSSRTRTPRPLEQRVAVIWAKQGAVLVVERPGPGLLAGTWGPPDGPIAAGESPEEEAVRLLAEGFGVRSRAVERLGCVTHAFTHRRWAVDVVRVDARGAPEARGWTRFRFLAPDQARDEVALSRLGRKVLETLEPRRDAPGPSARRRPRPHGGREPGRLT